ncbi:MAG: hypothetical protein GY820_02825, partial [Gammaproteobacteria bacterium]|nr:hypothetical protein [Gammaproteobacteria bacterium]
MNLRITLAAKYPPFRYYGVPMDRHYDEPLTHKTIVQSLRQVLVLAFNVNSNTGIQNKEQWDLQEKLDQIPMVGDYGLTPPKKFPLGMTEEQGKARWFALQRKSRPEWYTGHYFHDDSPEWAKLYGTKLVNEQEFRKIRAQGRMENESPQDYTDRLARCFVITHQGEEDHLKRVYERWQEIPLTARTALPTTPSDMPPHEIPSFVTRMHMENLILQREYLEELMMEIPNMRSMNKKNELSLNQRDLDYWEKRNDEYYGTPIMSLSSIEEQEVWNSQWR